jgi:hypothetical protein
MAMRLCYTGGFSFQPRLQRRDDLPANQVDTGAGGV